MIRSCCSIALFFLFSLPLFAVPFLPPKLTLKTEEKFQTIEEGKPFSIFLSIIHSEKQKPTEIDLEIEKPFLSVEKIAEEIINPDNLYGSQIEEAPRKTTFRITIPGQYPGIYSIGPIRLRTKEGSFESNSLALQILEPTISPLLNLETKVTYNDYPRTLIYPGERALFEYRLSFSTPLKITKEELPLLYPTGFITEGAPEIWEEEKTSLDQPSTQIIHQKARAQFPGEHIIGPSIIEAIPLQNEIKKLYRAVAPSISLCISPFPEKGKPNSFYGAVGSFSWRARIITNGALRVGTPFQIEYRAAGRGDLGTVRFPDKKSQASLHTHFIIEEWPIEGKQEGNTKSFIVQVKPRRSGNLFIPSLVVSSFDPISQKYLTSETLPIALSIKGSNGERESEITPFETIEGALYGIEPIPILPATVKKTYWSGKALLLWILFCTSFIASEWGLCLFLQKRKRVKEESKSLSETLFEQGIDKRIGSKQGYVLFKRAILTQLFEMKITEKLVENGEELPDTEPLLKEAKMIIRRIDQALYFGTDMTKEEAKMIREEVLLFRYSLITIARKKGEKQ